MDLKTTLAHGWRTYWLLRSHDAAPAWSRLLAGAALALAIAATLIGIVAAFGRVEPYPITVWVRAAALPVYLICLCITWTTLGSLYLAGALLPAAIAERISPVRDLRSALAVSVIAITGISSGLALGFTLVGYAYDFPIWSKFISAPMAMAKFVAACVVGACLNWSWWRMRLRQQAAQHDATEAQLRLLQAQMEPHFLFNTLANVQSLMDYDPPRAKQMLEAFSDYLRAGLGQMRHTESTLGAELAMVQTYLEMLKIRMGERLRFTIEAGAEARAARLPTLMLQPLVENAIHHGLEPKVEGGTISVSAQVEHGRLRLQVSDDGMGLDSARHGRRGGSGMALANLRARLQTRYRQHAALTLTGQDPGVCVLLDLPYRAA